MIDSAQISALTDYRLQTFKVPVDSLRSLQQFQLIKPADQFQQRVLLSHLYKLDNRNYINP